MRLPVYLLLFASVLFFTLPKVFSQYWGQSAGSFTIDEVMDIATAPNGDLVMCGYFTSSFSFMGQNLTNAGLSDIFVARITSSGSLVWVVRTGASQDDRALSIDVDNTGNIYIGGQFSGTTTIGTTNLTSTGQQDVFVAKLDGSGVFQWAVRGGGSGQDVLSDIAADASGNVTATGHFEQTATFGSNTFTATGEDVFVFKVNTSGAFQWSKHGSGPNSDKGIALDTDPSGNIYLTGQFNLNFTYDGNLHSNNLFNAIFLMRLDPQGNEAWFKRIGGGIQNIAYDIYYKSASEVFLTGDFEGSLVFFPNTNNPVNSVYPYSVFVSRLDNQGNMQWTEILGSNNRLTAKKVTAQPSGEVYITGMFECGFTEAALPFDTGAFYSMGYYDVFAAKYGSNGNRQWIKHAGSNGDDNARGLSPAAGGEPFYGMNFHQNLNLPVIHSGFTGGTPFNINTLPNCSSPTDDQYALFQSNGNKDFLFGKLFDPNREPLYYFNNAPPGCNYNFEEPQILGNSDTVTACIFTILNSVHHTHNNFNVNFQYLWSTGATTNFTYVSTTGWVKLTVTRADGCYSITDSVYVLINPAPPLPHISDDVIINTHAANTTPIILCKPDSAVLWTHPANGYTYQWLGPNGTVNDSITVANVSGVYTIKVTDSSGCDINNSVNVTIYDTLGAWNPTLFFCGDTCLQGDTLFICEGSDVRLWANDPLIPINTQNEDFFFYIVEHPSLDTTQGINVQVPTVNLPVDSSGWHYFEMVLTRYNDCDTLVVNMFDSVYIQLVPVPVIVLTVIGPQWLCPGDTNFFQVLGCTDSLTLPGGLVYNSGDTLVGINNEGQYTFTCYASGSNGCDASASQLITVSFYPQPTIVSQPANGLICPGDSILITADIPGTYAWFGPQGSIGISGPSIYASIGGFYYGILTDSSGCQLYSNTIEIRQYASPYIIAGPDAQVCSSLDTIILEIFSTSGSQLQWLPPLAGSDSIQYISQPGYYYATISLLACGLTDTAVIFIDGNHADAQIIPPVTVFDCEGDSILLEAIPGYENYTWLPDQEAGISLVVTAPGSYSVVVTDTAGCTDTSDVVVINFQPDVVPAPVVSDTLICFPDAITLTAYGTGIIRWYDAPVGGNLLFTGNQYQTPLLPGPDTFFVSQQIDSCTSERSTIFIQSDICDSIHIPNVFTPNGDGINDFVDFTLKGAYCFRVSIFNRWGMIIRELTDPENAFWYGENHEGNLVPDGVYHYVAEYCPKNLQPKKQVGFIHIFKNP